MSELGDAPDEARGNIRRGGSAELSIEQALVDSASSITSSAPRHSLTSASTLESKLDLSPKEVAAARRGVLRDSFFDKDAAGTYESTEEMQRKDPLGTQMWKLYHKTKG
ncbi:Sodium- and chloride-dependent GABA transporter 1 [Elasticomyces elasticus]|nr:Sodium- and chloride-dependent GABA transporter 1 [Elasticomyces elasticus]